MIFSDHAEVTVYAPSDDVQLGWTVRPSNHGMYMGGVGLEPKAGPRNIHIPTAYQVTQTVMHSSYFLAYTTPGGGGVEGYV